MMNGKWRKETGLILTAILLLCGGTPSGARETLVPEDSSKPSSGLLGETIFSCQSLGDGWATFVQREGKLSTNPIITWNTKHFGDDYTPDKRCQIVSDKLTNTVVKNGGNLANLNLRSGEIAVNNNQYVVICATTPAQPKCDLDNMLFTLKPENAKNPNLVLANMLSFTQGKASNNAVDENTLPASVALGGLVDNVFARESQKQLSVPLALPFSLILSFCFGAVVGGLTIFFLSKKSKEPELKRLEELVKTQENREQKAEERVKKMESEIENFQSKGAESAAELKRLEELVKTQENREQKAEERVKKMEGEIEKLKSKEAEAQAEVKRLQGLVQVGEGQEQNERKRRREAEAEVKRLQELMQTREREEQATQKQVKALEAELQELKSQRAGVGAAPKVSSSQKSDSEEVELKSATGLNYNRLRDLLAGLQFREADEETWRCLLQAAGQEEKNYLRKEDIDNFPCEDLQTIDRLWVKYSNGRFGFSVQKQIYLKLGGTQQYNQQIWETFGASVGWRSQQASPESTGNIWEALDRFSLGGNWLSYNHLNFGTGAPFGHLPCGGALRGGWDGLFMGGGEGFFALMQRLITCKL